MRNINNSYTLREPRSVDQEYKISSFRIEESKDFNSFKCVTRQKESNTIRRAKSPCSRVATSGRKEFINKNLYNRSIIVSTNKGNCAPNPKKRERPKGKIQLKNKRQAKKRKQGIPSFKRKDIPQPTKLAEVRNDLNKVVGYDLRFSDNEIKLIEETIKKYVLKNNKEKIISYIKELIKGPTKNLNYINKDIDWHFPFSYKKILNLICEASYGSTESRIYSYFLSKKETLTSHHESATILYESKWEKTGDETDVAILSDISSSEEKIEEEKHTRQKSQESSQKSQWLEETEYYSSSNECDSETEMKYKTVKNFAKNYKGKNLSGLVKTMAKSLFK